MEKFKIRGKEQIPGILALPIAISFILIYFNPVLGIIALILCLALYFHLKNINDYNQGLLQKYVDQLDLSFNSITKSLVFEMPFPIVVLNEKKQIKWHNTYFRNLFPDEELIGSDINKIIPAIVKIDLKETKSDRALVADIGDKKIQFYFNNVKNDELDEMETFIYGIDNTYDESIKQLFKDKRLVFFTIYLDNYEDLRNATDSLNRPQVLGAIDRTINEYFKSRTGVVRKYENDRYMVVMEYQDYMKIYESKFSILDEVRNISHGNLINPTLSIGVGVLGQNPNEIYNDSRVSIEI